MMMAAPTIVAQDGTSPNTTKPKITAQTIIEYWYGTTTLAGASFSDLFTQSSAATEMMPAAKNSTRLPADGVTHARGNDAGREQANGESADDP